MPWFWKSVWVCAVITLGFWGLARGNIVAIAAALGFIALGMALTEHRHH